MLYLLVEVVVVLLLDGAGDDVTDLLGFGGLQVVLPGQPVLPPKEAKRESYQILIRIAVIQRSCY